jgi:hypothetical protein
MRHKIWSASDISERSGEMAISGGGEGIPTSDIRAKEQVAQVGETKHGLPLYRFHYKGGDEAYLGVMAQDVLKVMPEAVTVGDDGFYRVNYGMLGISMIRLDKGVADAGAGGEGVVESDVRLKDRIEQVGTVAIAAPRQD